MTLREDGDRPSIEDLLDLSGKSAIVTGSAQGIGRGIADRLHDAGAAIVVADRAPAAGATAAEALNAARAGSAIAVGTDVTVEADVEALFAAAVERFGGIDILVNAAGIYPITPLVELETDLFEHVMRVNTVGVFMTMRAAARQMIAQGRGGRIINVTSIDAVHPIQPAFAAYDASKHATWGMTKNVALELAEHGIAVNALAPGATMTPGAALDTPERIEAISARVPLGRMAQADEMGRVALFLASDLSSYLTGSQIIVDGGLLLR